MSEFKVGERAWVIPFKLGPIDIPGKWCTEVTIVGPLEPHHSAVGGLVYKVRDDAGLEAYATPRILRKIIPPEELCAPEGSAQTVSGGT